MCGRMRSPQRVQLLTAMQKSKPNRLFNVKLNVKLIFGDTLMMVSVAFIGWGPLLAVRDRTRLQYWLQALNSYVKQQFLSIKCIDS